MNSSDLIYLIQGCLSQRCGRKARTRSSSWRGPSCCPRKTSLSDTLWERMWVILLPFTAHCFMIKFELHTHTFSFLSSKIPHQCVPLNSLRCRKRSSTWRTWMQFSSQRRSAMLTACRSPTCRRNGLEICLFTMKTGRWGQFIYFFRWRTWQLQNIKTIK